MAGHAGHPMIDDMLTLLQANAHAYVAGLIWSDPLKEVDRYIRAASAIYPTSPPSPSALRTRAIWPTW